MGPPGNRGSWGPCVLAHTQKAYEKECTSSAVITRTAQHLCLHSLYQGVSKPKSKATIQGWTDSSWGPRAIGDHGAPVSLPKLKKSYEKGTRGISWGPLLTPGPRAVPEFPNGQSAP
ncbi:unnamed protein product, partial [Staurois parvus]